MYERILKIDPGHEAAKEAHYNLRGLEQDAQELGVDIRLVLYLISGIFLRLHKCSFMKK